MESINDIDNIEKYIELIDRISTFLNLPHIRKYRTSSFPGVGSARDYLSKLNYDNVSHVLLDDLVNTDYLFITTEIRIGAVSKNHLKYDKVIQTIININIDNLLEMSDEEFELLLRLN